MLKQIKKGIVFSLSSLMLLSSFSIVGRAEEVGAPPVDKEDVIEFTDIPEGLANEISQGTAESANYTKGASLGKFQLVGYSGDGMTYSGAKTQAKHTIAADLTVLPLGTKIFIGDTVYTVEDIGSGVKGKMVDIYFDTMAEARALTQKGRVYEEVFVAVPKQ